MFAGGGVVVSALLASLTAPAIALECLGRSSVVATYPAGDIRVFYGNPLEIYCSVEPPYNSSQLKFSRRVMGASTPVKEVQIVNSTTAFLHIPRPERQKSTYDCDVGNVTPSIFCYNAVVVDTAPGNITEFQCRSYNLDRLVCRWKTPVFYASTNYSLSYNIYHMQTNSCRVDHIGNNYSCEFRNNNSDPTYRPQEEYYYFNLTSVSRFGVSTQKFKVDHFAVLIPDKPQNLVKRNLTAHSILLQWQIPRDIADFSPGVNHSIKYQIKTVDNLTTWRLADISSLRSSNKTTFQYVLSELPYAHWSYDVRVFIKSVKAPDEEEFWSKFEATTFTTLSERPPRPPRTEIGAFQSNKQGTSRDVYVYWQQLDNFDESGENFTYRVVIGDSYLQSNKSSYAHFTTSLNAINVSISSLNNYGSSLDKSYIYVPAHTDILREPTSFTKTVFGNKTYDLRWHSPHNTNFDSYTLFWCSNTDSEQCSGKLNFTKLSPTETSYRVMVSEDNKTYLFAISANRGKLSSGMVWASCNLPAENAKNRVAVFKRGPNLGRRSVELQWSLGCSFSEGHVRGYNITYCLLPNHAFHCSGTDDPYLEILNPLQTNVSITNLMPHSTYNFRIAVIYKDGSGYNSEDVDATTLEDKPSNPLNLKISHVNSSSMRVSWDPPAVKNGILLEYLIKYRIDDDPNKEKQDKLPVPDKSTQSKDERQHITLSGLSAFTNYSVYVQACTTDCSIAVSAGQVRTAIGAPNKMNKPELNGTLKWQAPDVPGGTLDLYQIQISDKNHDNIQIINTTGTLEHDVPQCDFSNVESTLYYKVRAINFDTNKEHGVRVISGNVTYSQEKEPWAGSRYESEWSVPETLNCGTKTSAVIFWILGIVTAVVFMIMFAFGSRKIWIRFKTMTDIHGVVLPPGLGPIDEKESKGQLGGSWSPPGKNKDEKSFPAVAGDEVLLLPPPSRATDTKDFSGSSESTDSTTLSLKSKEPRERDAVTSDDASDDSSIHAAIPTEPAPKLQSASSGYKTFATQPTIQDYHDDDYYRDADSTCSDDLSDAPLPSGYVQPAILPPPPRLDIPSGYVRAQDATLPSFPPPSMSFPPLAVPKSMLTTRTPSQPDNPLMPKFLPMEWKLAPERVGEVGGGKTVASTAPLPPVKPGGGYVTHADAVINKHLNIISNNHLGEEPALPDPNMSPDAYCRFAWNSDPTADNNLHSLLRGQAPAAPAPSLFVLQAPKD